MPNSREESSVRKMVLTGTGQIKADPDIAILRLGVQTNGEDVTKAQSDNAMISQNVLDAIKELGVSDIKTFQYQIEKVYDYENGQRIDRGYSVRNIFEIRTADLENVGSIIDTAVNNGANVVDLITFDVANPDAYYQQALTLALNNAFQKAKTLTSSLRIMFNAVPIKITENTPSVTPFSPVFAARGEAYTTPVEAGTKQIDASITVEFAY